MVLPLLNGTGRFEAKKMILHILAASSLFMLVFFMVIIAIDWYEQ